MRRLLIIFSEAFAISKRGDMSRLRQSAGKASRSSNQIFTRRLSAQNCGRATIPSDRTCNRRLFNFQN